MFFIRHKVVWDVTLFDFEVALKIVHRVKMRIKNFKIMVEMGYF